jgi:hypothetical protein
MQHVSVSCDTLGELRSQYDVSITYATEIEIGIQSWGFTIPPELSSAKRLRQVLITNFYVSDTLAYESRYNNWRGLLDTMLQHGISRIVIDQKFKGRMFACLHVCMLARLPTSVILAKEAHEAGITFVLRGIIGNRLTRACAMRLARSPGIEIEDDIHNDDHSIAKRDADLDMARLGTPGLNAAWACVSV